eukprot:1707674-Rhodomonas_salina.2
MPVLHIAAAAAMRVPDIACLQLASGTLVLGQDRVVPSIVRSSLQRSTLASAALTSILTSRSLPSLPQYNEVETRGGDRRECRGIAGRRDHGRGRDDSGEGKGA